MAMEMNKRRGTLNLFLGYLCVILACLIIVFGFFTVRLSRYHRQISLGDEYLEEMDYENAAIAYTNAIEISAKRPVGYLKLTVAYIQLGEYGKAYDILELAESNADIEKRKKDIDRLRQTIEKKLEMAEQKEEQLQQKETEDTHKLDVPEPDTENIIEVTDYLETPNPLVDMLEMEPASSWQFGTGESYVKDNFYLEMSNDIYSMKNEGASYVTLYGIKLGDSLTEAMQTVKDRGWSSYSSNNGINSFLALINDRPYLLSLSNSEEGKITSWYLNNWPEGEDIYEVLNGEKSTSNIPSEQWKQEYINYIADQNFLASKLININGDAIPELYIDYNSYAEGGVVCSYVNGELIEQHVYNGGLSYIEGENLFRSSGGHMDGYYDDIYTMQDGMFVRLYSGTYGAENNANVQLDASGMPIYQYFWNGTQVSSEEEYMNLLNQVFNTEQAISPYDNTEYSNGRYIGNGLCDFNEIIEAINNY